MKHAYSATLGLKTQPKPGLRTGSADHVLQMPNNSTTQDLEQLSRHRELHDMIIDISQSVHVLLTLEYHDCHHK